MTRTTVFEPNEHPNASSMNAILFLFEIFGIISLLLSCILVINLITSIVNKQSKQIAIMKSIGATKWQVTVMYLVFVALLGGIATLIAIPMAAAASKFLVEINSFLLNFTVDSMNISLSTFSVQAVSGVLLPSVVSLIPIWKVTGKPARESLSSTGLSTEHIRKTHADSAMKPSLRVSFVNTFRRKSRFFFITASLTGACIMLVTALNLRESTSYTFDRAMMSKNYDIQFILNRDYTEEEVHQVIQPNNFIESYEFMGAVWHRFSMKVREPAMLFS